MKKLTPLLLLFLLAIIAAIYGNKLDTMRRVEREKEKAVQDSILAPTRCVLDSVAFYSREAAEAFAKSLVGADTKSSTRTETHQWGRRRRGVLTETCSQITREYVDIVIYKEKFYEIYLLDSRWVFRKIR